MCLPCALRAAVVHWLAPLGFCHYELEGIYVHVQLWDVSLVYSRCKIPILSGNLVCVPQCTGSPCKPDSRTSILQFRTPTPPVLLMTQLVFTSTTTTAVAGPLRLPTTCNMAPNIILPRGCGSRHFFGSTKTSLELYFLPLALAFQKQSREVTLTVSFQYRRHHAALQW